jgi:acetoin utilization deacetylase AcuC-like enzyme
VHHRPYIELVEREVSQNRAQLSTGDTDINRHSSQAARAAVGCALNAVDAVCEGTVQNGFCVTRPPGHHASAERGMGFCLFNTVAVAARYAQTRFGLNRVAILDWDVHHGNGTQDIFYSDDSVLFFSTHQWPLYPGTGAADERGEGNGEGLTINCPFPAGSGREEIVGAFEQRFIPAANEFKPEMLFISAGFDSRIGDPLGQFTLSDQDFADLTRMMLDVAARHCRDRVVSVLEGGYSLSGLAQAAEAHVRVLQS